MKRTKQHSEHRKNKIKNERNKENNEIQTTTKKKEDRSKGITTA